MDISIPGYIQNTLLKLQQPSPKNSEDAIFKSDPKQYGAKVQFAKEWDRTQALSEAAIKILKQNILSLLFYEKAVDMTLLVVLITLMSVHAHETEATARAMVQLLSYCDTHMDAVIQYKKKRHYSCNTH